MVHKKDGSTPWYVLNAPELGGAFQKMEHLVDENRVLEDKTEALIRLALTSTFRSATATEDNIREALSLGASREEITEVLLISAIQRGKTQLSWIQESGAEQLLVAD